ncbi:MAG: hypothetical protein CM1200mP26_00950 [Acidimicrobiales bacterium]|nr:MAG: hypothetical protein CM1200mP26_00950 [Acidimicrobiales bacterium]
MPPAGRLVATADHCPVAALAVGDHMLGVQAHPEFDAHYAKVLYRGPLTQNSPKGGFSTRRYPRWTLHFTESKGPKPGCCAS